MVSGRWQPRAGSMLTHQIPSLSLAPTMPLPTSTTMHCRIKLKRLPMNTDACETPKDRSTGVGKVKRTSRACMHSATTVPSFRMILCHPSHPLLQPLGSRTRAHRPRRHPHLLSGMMPSMPVTPWIPWMILSYTRHPSTTLNPAPRYPIPASPFNIPIA